MMAPSHCSPILPYPLLSYLTLSYPTLPSPILPYPLLPYPFINKIRWIEYVDPRRKMWSDCLSMTSIWTLIGTMVVIVYVKTTQIHPIILIILVKIISIDLSKGMEHPDREGDLCDSNPKEFSVLENDRAMIT